MKFLFLIFFSSRKRKPDRIAVPYTIFNSFHQEIFPEVKYLDKYY